MHAGGNIQSHALVKQTHVTNTRWLTRSVTLQKHTFDTPSFKVGIRCCLISINRYLHMYTESRQRDKILVPEAFWFPFVVQVVLTSQLWVGFGCMQLNSPSGNPKRRNALAEMQSRSPLAMVWKWFIFFSNSSAFICRYLFMEISYNVVCKCYIIVMP